MRRRADDLCFGGPRNGAYLRIQSMLKVANEYAAAKEKSVNSQSKCNSGKAVALTMIETTIYYEKKRPKPRRSVPKSAKRQGKQGGKQHF